MAQWLLCYTRNISFLVLLKKAFWHNSGYIVDGGRPATLIPRHNSRYTLGRRGTPGKGFSAQFLVHWFLYFWYTKSYITDASLSWTINILVMGYTDDNQSLLSIRDKTHAFICQTLRYRESLVRVWVARLLLKSLEETILSGISKTRKFSTGITHNTRRYSTGSQFWLKAT
jgi:hypothetical protein